MQRLNEKNEDYLSDEWLKGVAIRNVAHRVKATVREIQDAHFMIPG